MKADKKDETINRWLGTQPIEPGPTFTQDTVTRAHASRRERQSNNILTFTMPLAAAAALVIGFYVSISGWSGASTSEETDPLYSSMEYLELEELLIMNESIESLAHVAGNFTEPEYYW